eukprot:INCI8927.2.p1 GENE.INCI8927.2~~INCI8927.2.p1  ORF type:complete len:156 (+),score=6.85 INCI8927.2:557-1024(+)
MSEHSSPSVSEGSMRWLLVVAAGSVIVSLIEAWLATLIVYGKVTALKRLFPAPHNLIRSHIDYLMMATLLCVTYFVCDHLSIELPSWVTTTLCIGAVYNPFGFFVKAIDPQSGNAETVLGRVLVCAGFLPVTIGFVYPMVLILARLIWLPATAGH